jgi:hypothetical protein
MYCSLILWNLSQSEQTVQSLREYLRDYAVDAYSQVPGLRQKIWVSSTGEDGEMWGAVYLWDNKESAYGRPPGVSRVVQLIGYAPTQRTYFSVEAATDGASEVGALTAGIGLAFESPCAAPLTRPQEFVPPGGADTIIRRPGYDTAPGGLPAGQTGEDRQGIDIKQ